MSCRHELAVSVKDMLTTRMRLAFLNSEARTHTPLTHAHWALPHHRRVSVEKCTFPSLPLGGRVRVHVAEAAVPAAGAVQAVGPRPSHAGDALRSEG